MAYKTVYGSTASVPDSKRVKDDARRANAFPPEAIAQINADCLEAYLQRRRNRGVPEEGLRQVRDIYKSYNETPHERN